MWTARATGDMTLSVLDENNIQILKVDMLGANTMKSGTEGALLTRTLNSLFVVSQFSENRSMKEIIADSPYPDDGIFPLPWSYMYNSEKRELKIKSAKGALCNRKYPKSFNDEYIGVILKTVEAGINRINKTQERCE